MNSTHPRTRRAVLEAALVLILGFCAGLFNNAFLARGIPLVGQWNKEYGVPSPGGMHDPSYGNVEINLEQAKRHFDEGALFLDARLMEDYQAEHIPGAVPFPEDEMEAQMNTVLAAIEPGTTVVTYCESMECDSSHLAATALRQAGIEKIFVFAGGVREWKKSGYHLEGIEEAQ